MMEDADSGHSITSDRQPHRRTTETISASVSKPKWSHRRKAVVVEYADTGSGSEGRRYPFNLSFYRELPEQDCTVSLKDFEASAIARLKLMRVIERVNASCPRKYSLAWKADIAKELSSLGLSHFALVGNLPFEGTLSDEEKHQAIMDARKFDHISHYISRLAFCRNPELIRAFVAMELEFFQFKSIQSTELKPFLESEMKLRKLSVEDVSEILEELNCSNYTIDENTNREMDYYEVDFTQVIDLVRIRRVYLKKGRAYVPFKELGSLFFSKFRKELTESLAATAQLLPLILEDERISQILTDFEKRYTGPDFATMQENGNLVTAAAVSEYSKRSFPLCMKSLHDVLEKEHHLKHYGRLQLGLFLKTAGLPMNEAITYWRSNFAKDPGFDGNRFDKQYIYSIRHMYGKEGRYAEYSAYGCTKIINSSAGPTREHHGCPFRLCEGPQLVEKLVAANIGPQGRAEILNLVQNRHYQIACQKYFEWTHNQTPFEGGVQHPNQYFYESQKARTVRPRALSAVAPSLPEAPVAGPSYSSGNPTTMRSKRNLVEAWFNTTKDTDDHLVDTSSPLISI